MLIVAHGDRAVEIAMAEEDRAWRGRDNCETEKWRRVLAGLQRHYEAAGRRHPGKILRDL